MVETWQPAFGETSMMPGSEVLEKLIVVLLVLRDSCKGHPIFDITPSTLNNVHSHYFVLCQSFLRPVHLKRSFDRKVAD
jgi:hypothetical protein